MLLDEKLLPYYDLKSFDDLPIPFRCVATDMVSGQEHVFKDGSLAQAMRSTMSIPGVFAPVQHSGQVYSDGAAVNNLPVDVARSMGADIVIAVYLDTGPFDPKSLSSLVGVAGRNVAIMVAANELNSMKSANVLLKADVSKFTSADFEESAQIIPKGIEVAQAHAGELEKICSQRLRVADVCGPAKCPAQNDASRTEVCGCLRHARSAAGSDRQRVCQICESTH